nr:type II toxin-antitoxin system HigB family toxin [Halomonas llamarensis]
MRVISKAPFEQAQKRFPNDASALSKTYKALRWQRFDTPDDMKAVFATLDNFRYRDKWWVLDIGGNNLRVIVYIDFYKQWLFVKHIVNHAEYDKLCSKYAKEEEQ